MWDCEESLRELVRSVEPTAPQKAAASRSQNYVRALLQSGQFGDRVIGEYLSGSYARDTALAPIDDVDIIILINPEGWPQNFWSAKPDPERVLQSFARATRYRYPNSSVHVQRRSVCLTLNHLCIDIVPGIESHGEGDRIQIPDTDSGEWITSAPKRHTAIATEINQMHGGRFKPEVKLLKYWNYQLPECARLKSFAIETLAATLFSDVDLPSLQEGLGLFFDFLAGQKDQAVLYQWPKNFGVHMSVWSHKLPDLAGTGSNLMAKVDDGRRIKFLEQAIRSRDHLIAARKARSPAAAAERIGAALRML